MNIFENNSEISDIVIDFEGLYLYIQSGMFLRAENALKWGRIHGKRVDSFNESDHGV